MAVRDSKDDHHRLDLVDGAIGVGSPGPVGLAQGFGPIRAVSWQQSIRAVSYQQFLAVVSGLVDLRHHDC